MLDKQKKRNIIISDEEPEETLVRRENFVWVDTTTKQVKGFINGAWVREVDFISSQQLALAISALSSIYAPIGHSHPELGDIKQVNFVDVIEVEGNKGVSAEIPLEKIKTLVFSKGILVKYE
jgi:hypothetical protein